MFGYVKPVVSELLVKEHEFYKATYCGICRSMKKVRWKDRGRTGTTIPIRSVGYYVDDDAPQFEHQREQH